MVLKKSNSPFNSGCTQKCFHKGVYRVNNELSGELLSITLRGIPPRYDENYPSAEHAKALEKIYDYLGYSGPSLKTFHESDVNRWDQTQKTLSISLNKLWFIPERVHELMNEENFLNGEEGFAEIRVRRVKHVADRDAVHQIESCVLNPRSKEKKAKNSRRNERPKGKKRGAQRRHLLTQPPIGDDDDDYYDWASYNWRKIVDIELRERDQVDARVLGCRFDGYADWKKIKSKSKSKSKGCVNGKMSYLYNPTHEQNIHTMLDSCKAWDEDDYYLIEDNDDITHTMVEDCEDYYNYRNRKQIYDFQVASPESVSRKVKDKLRNGKRKEDIHTDEEQFDNVNPASSQTTIKHPKGSFQVIARPSDVVENTDNTITSEDDLVHLTSDEIKESLDDFSEIQEINNNKTEMSATFKLFESSDKFVAINLHVPKNMEGNMILSSDKCTVISGNCYPPVFCIDIDQNDSNSKDGWSVVGISSGDISNTEPLEWEVTLKNTKSCGGHSNDEIRDDFFCKLEVANELVLEFHDLVNMALASIDNIYHKTISGKDDFVSKSTTKRKSKTSVKNDYSVVNDCNNSVTTVCSMEEALEKLQKDDITQNSHSQSKAKQSKIKITRENVECDICLNTCDKHGQKDTGLITMLPCNHSFCFGCWQSHIFHHTITTRTKIKCMYTDCKEVLNKTMMSSFIPEQHLTKLYKQNEERLIDSSPLCQWCPQSKCNKVSIIPEWNQHVQDFGCCVVCDCEKSYCFSCQKKPHWPISCSQAAAYRNLLRKVNGEIPLDDVTCRLELKPCPQCRYPIEKSVGCPHMTCEMCGYDFCWKCLQEYYRHRRENCVGDEDINYNYKTYKLHNDVINSFPLKFFANALEMKTKLKSVSKDSIKGWLKRLNQVKNYDVQLPFQISIKVEGETLVKTRAVHLATDIVSFLTESYTFLEYFYVLLSFGNLNEENENNKDAYASTKHLMDRLIFSASRLEVLIVEKSLRQILVSENTCQMFLESGSEVLKKLRNRVASIQETSKDVPTQPIGDLDPKNYYRYK